MFTYKEQDYPISESRWATRLWDWRFQPETARKSGRRRVLQTRRVGAREALLAVREGRLLRLSADAVSHAWGLVLASEGLLEKAHASSPLGRVRTYQKVGELCSGTRRTLQWNPPQTVQPNTCLTLRPQPDAPPPAALTAWLLNPPDVLGTVPELYRGGGRVRHPGFPGEASQGECFAKRAAPYLSRSLSRFKISMWLSFSLRYVKPSLGRGRQVQGLFEALTFVSHRIFVLHWGRAFF